MPSYEEGICIVVGSLGRDSGPSGWMRIEQRVFWINGWELFEGEEEEDPNMCRGWFRCRERSFAPALGTEIRLHLRHWKYDERILDATLLKVLEDGELWEFRARR